MILLSHWSGSPPKKYRVGLYRGKRPGKRRRPEESRFLNQGDGKTRRRRVDSKGEDLRIAFVSPVIFFACCWPSSTPFLLLPLLQLLLLLHSWRKDRSTGMEAQQLVWKGAIPLQIHLHESEVTTLPPPPPFLVSVPHLFFPLFSCLVLSLLDYGFDG